MLEHWLQTPENPHFQEDSHPGDRLGYHLAKPPKEGRPATQKAIGLIGVDSRWTKYVRRHLYRFGYRMPDIRIHDFGNLRKTDPDFVTGPLVELLAAEICPVLIGAHPVLIKSVLQAYSFHKLPFRPAVVHETIPEFFLQSDHQGYMIGVQQHILPRQIPSGLQTLHLNNAIRDIDAADTLIRDSNCLFFDLSAVSAAELPAQHSISASGFNTMTACTLMRSAGLHAGTKVVMISGHDPMSLQLDQSANVTAQMIWYLIEAYQQCIIESPLKSDHCTGYVVHIDGYQLDLKFYKSEKTGRWWVTFSQNERVFPCTYRDYVEAVNGTLSEWVLTCVSASLENAEQGL